MTAHVLQDLSETLRALNAMALSLDDCIDHVTTRAIETGGNIKLPQPGNGWDSQRLEIELHGVAAEGADWPEALRNWKKAALAQQRGVA